MSRLIQPVFKKCLHAQSPSSGFNIVKFGVRTYVDEASSLTILQKLKGDMKQAMREKQRTKLTVIKSVISDIGYAEKSTQPFSVIKEDNDVAPLIQKAIKKRQDSMGQYTSGGRDDLAAQEREELEILQSYLPTPYSEEEIAAKVMSVIKELNATSVKDLGKVVKAVDLDPARVTKAQIANLAKKALSN